MKIKVTQEHIDKGERCEPFGCPIALAAKDAGIKNASVGAFHMHLNDEADESIELPSIAKRFRSEFDMGNEVEPFEFEINEN